MTESLAVLKSTYYTFGPGCQIPFLGVLLEAAVGRTASGSFVDIGAFDGKQWSNTYGLAMMGWRGLLVEPQPAALAQARQHLAGKRAEFVQAAVSDYSGEAKLFLGGSLSTISEHQKQIYLDMEWSSVTGLAEGKYETVKVVTYNQLMEMFDWPATYHYLSIDVEGSEIDVLREANLARWRPTLVSVETHELYENPLLAEKSLVIDRIMAKNGYKKIHADHINTVYIYEER